MKDFYFTKKEKIGLILAVVIFVFLFISSSMTYHQQKINSSTLDSVFGFLRPYLDHISINYGGRIHSVSANGYAGFVQFLIRKFAHFSSFLILGFGLYAGLKRLFFNHGLAFIFIWPLTVTAAVFDEYHQFLTGGRTPSIHDVVLDSFGALCGILLFLLYQLIVKKLKK